MTEYTIVYTAPATVQIIDYVLAKSAEDAIASASDRLQIPQEHLDALEGRHV